MEWIAGLFIGFCLGMLVFDWTQRKLLQQHGLEKRQQLLARMSEVHSEIAFRSRHLDQYEFQEHNLSDVLVVQPQIVLC